MQPILSVKGPCRGHGADPTLHLEMTAFWHSYSFSSSYVSECALAWLPVMEYRLGMWEFVMGRTEVTLLCLWDLSWTLPPAVGADSCSVGCCEQVFHRLLVS
jgi:hypothetical protein